MDFKGKTALVTGAASGIGLCYVKELLANGVQHVTIADIQAEQGKTVAQSLNAQFGKDRVLFVKCDVTKVPELENAIKTTIATFNRLDIMINNAGILNDKKWELMFAINVNAVVNSTLLAYKYMGKDNGGKGGVIVNIASIVGLQTFASFPLYVATKHAVMGLSRSFGMPYHYNRTGVKMLIMCPGITETPLIFEANSNALEPHFAQYAEEEFKSLPSQPPEIVAKGLITLLKHGENGSAWVAEGGEPIYEIEIPDRLTLRKEKKL